MENLRINESPESKSPQSCPPCHDIICLSLYQNRAAHPCVIVYCFLQVNQAGAWIGRPLLSRYFSWLHGIALIGDVFAEKATILHEIPKHIDLFQKSDPPLDQGMNGPFDAPHL